VKSMMSRKTTEATTPSYTIHRTYTFIYTGRH
jgi:hypothetical protein